MSQNAEPRLDWTLPASLYRDPQHYERERQSILAANWSLFAWSARVTKPGDCPARLPQCLPASRRHASLEGERRLRQASRLPVS